MTEVDRRTRAGRVMQNVIRTLVDQIGSPTAAQSLLIQSAALKAVRLSLLSEKLLTDDKGLAEGNDHHALAWLNSLRLDLMALGLERKEHQVLDLRGYMKTAAEKPITDVPPAAEPVATTANAA